MRFGDNGSEGCDGTEVGSAAEELSRFDSFPLEGVGERGGVCSEGEKKFDDA